MAGALVALADFKSVAARPSALGGFDSHTFPPVRTDPPADPGEVTPDPRAGFLADFLSS